MEKTIEFATRGRGTWWSVSIIFENRDWKDVLAIAWSLYPKKCYWQCINELDKYIKKKWNKKHKALWREIKYLWENYHLNDMHPWTRKQEQWLKENWITNRANDYDKVCDKLFMNYLLYDKDIEDYPELKDCKILGYKFWSKRIYRPIPFEDKVRIIKLFWV